MAATTLPATRLALDHEEFALRGVGPAALSTRVVHVPEPIPFGVSPSRDLRWLRLLREATSHAVRLRWTLGGVPHLPVGTLAHLVPPEGGVGADAERYARAWAGEYRYGLFYYRHGPGFVAVKDVRPEHEMGRLVIDEGSEHFLAMARATTLADLDPAARAAVDDAVEAELAVVADDTVLVLPYRMRNWPVPYIAV
ncbi:DUF5825 family protein [Kitasatospora sp. NPDC001539]|uniref:DUF5825 family protein n=1 Tax=Kitasatospora sp. NPDC001539 TaxID=3154384 RepID=UPI00332ADBB7